MANRGWVGVDLDGTVAEYDKWRGPGHIGAPIVAMVDRVKALLKSGTDVRIFTARVYLPPESEVPAEEYAARVNEVAIAWQAIEAFCMEQFGRTLPITCIKDFSMVTLFDDRARQVQPNTGIVLDECYAMENMLRAALNQCWKERDALKIERDQLAWKLQQQSKKFGKVLPFPEPK